MYEIELKKKHTVEEDCSYCNFNIKNIAMEDSMKVLKV